MVCRFLALDPSPIDEISDDTPLRYAQRGLQIRRMLLEVASLGGVVAGFDMVQFPDQDRMVCGMEIHRFYPTISAQDVDSTGQTVH